MAFDCSGEWNSCINTGASKCVATDPGFEGTMTINPPDPLTGFFVGRFFPKGGGPPEDIAGQCSDKKPHIQVWRGLHYYKGDKVTTKTVKGKRTKLRILKKGKRIKPQGDDEWVGTKTT